MATTQFRGMPATRLRRVQPSLRAEWPAVSSRADRVWAVGLFPAGRGARLHRGLAGTRRVRLGVGLDLGRRDHPVMVGVDLVEIRQLRRAEFVRRDFAIM